MRVITPFNNIADTTLDGAGNYIKINVENNILLLWVCIHIKANQKFQYVILRTFPDLSLIQLGQPFLVCTYLFIKLAENLVGYIDANTRKIFKICKSLYK
jgi:hypothetical protein